MDDDKAVCSGLLTQGLQGMRKQPVWDTVCAETGKDEWCFEDEEVKDALGKRLDQLRGRDLLSHQTVHQIRTCFALTRLPQQVPQSA